MKYATKFLSLLIQAGLMLGAAYFIWRFPIFMLGVVTGTLFTLLIVAFAQGAEQAKFKDKLEENRRRAWTEDEL